ncbi:hypothetical protein C1646_696667, partial [Rhizophagus diaphanus]
MKLPIPIFYKKILLKMRYNRKEVLRKLRVKHYDVLNKNLKSSILYYQDKQDTFLL